MATVDMKNGSSSPVKKCPKMEKTELEEFDTLFSELVESLNKSNCKELAEIQDAVIWFKEVSNYNVPFGKKNRGIAVSMSYKAIRPDATMEELRLARILGWCVEWLQAFFLVADDVMDKSETRRGKPCWYKKDGVGLMAVNDAFYLEACVYQILKNNFRGKSYYLDLVDLFHEVSLQTITGQCLDLITSPDNRINFEKFTMDRYLAIVKWKTAFYSFFLPVALAMYMAGIQDSSTHQSAKAILIKMGIFFQIQDDFLDCYGDPEVIGKIGTDIEENKCSWLIVQALERVDSKQRHILQDNYGQHDADKVAKVKAVYRELNLEQLFHEYEESSYQQLMTDIDKFSGSLPKDVFIGFAKKIYKRNK